MDFIHFSKVRLWAKNPRKNENAVPRLMELLKIHGQKTRIAVWSANNVVYKGNTTYKALTRLIREWTIYKQGESRELFDQLRRGFIKVEWLQFANENAAMAYAIADNKSNEFAEWDDDILRGLLKTPEIVKDSGFSEVEKRALFFEPEPERIAKINAANFGLKDKIILIVLDAAKRDMFKLMLTKWIQSTGFKGIEVK